MFSPYRKLAKLSLNRERLSCISCRCMRFASRSAIESESSTKAGSIVSSGRVEDPPGLARKARPSRTEVREFGLKGVVGREEGAWLREVDRLTVPSAIVRVVRSGALMLPSFTIHIKCPTGASTSAAAYTRCFHFSACFSVCQEL